MRVPQNSTADTTTLVVVMVFRQQNPYPRQCSPRSLLPPWGVPRPKWLNDYSTSYMLLVTLAFWNMIEHWLSHEWCAIAEARSCTSCDRIVSHVNLFFNICNMYQIHNFRHRTDILHSSTFRYISASRALRALSRVLQQFVFWFEIHQRNLIVKAPQRVRCNKYECHRRLESDFVLPSLLIEVHC